MNLRVVILNIRPRVVNSVKFLKLLRVEPFIFLVALQIGLKGMPNGQLIQDKICTHWYDTGELKNGSYCHDLPSIKETGNDPGHFKSRILADATQFGKNY